MNDRDAVHLVATDIAAWELASERLPMPELSAMVTRWQTSLTESLYAFNEAYGTYADCDESADLLKTALGEVTRRATAVAIFTLAITYRARTGGAAQLNADAGPGGRPSPGPASQNDPLPREKQRSFGMLNATSAMPARVVLDWRRGRIGPLAPCVLCGGPRCAGPRPRTCPATRPAPRPGSPATPATHLISPG